MLNKKKDFNDKFDHFQVFPIFSGILARNSTKTDVLAYLLKELLFASCIHSSQKYQLK